MKSFKRLPLLTTALLCLAQYTFAQISGMIWHDHNINNIKEQSEQPQSQVNVKVFDTKGRIITSTYSDLAGRYKLNVPGIQRVRVEFSDIPEGYVISSSKPATQFVTSPAEISLGIYHPATYTGDSPIAVQTVFAFGDLSIKAPSPISSLVKYSAVPYSGMLYSGMTLVQNTGSIWGLAYDRQRRILYSSSIAKRNSALGSQGPGGIYMTSLNSNETKPFINLDALGFKSVPAPLNRQLSTQYAPVHDSLMFSQVGKIGLGGIDISDDSRYLFTVNLYDRHLYRIKLNVDGSAPKAEDISRYPVPVSGFDGGEARPFAVRYYNGKVYLGIVCDAQVSQKVQDLTAYVYEIQADDLDSKVSTFKEVTRFSLNYPRGTLAYDIRGWFPWTDNYNKVVVPEQSGWAIYPQPILAAIEFDTDGSMIVSLMDRLGHQTSEYHIYRRTATGQFFYGKGLSGGDILRLSKDTSGYHLEQNGKSGTNVSLGKDNGQGPGGGEFYYQDNYADSNTEWHQETATGGLALLPAKRSVMVSIREPDRSVTGGVKWFNNETGASTYAFSIFPGGLTVGYLWKANNVGDIEIVKPLPPIEIGDRVWLDNNTNGIQEADEPVLPGIILQLYRDGQYIGNTISGSDGHYSFNAGNVTESIRSRTNYEVRIPLKQQARVLIPTLAFAGNSPELDSDAEIKSPDYASITLTTKNPGENILNLDFGFQCADKPDVIAKLDCKNNIVKMSLSNYDIGQRFDVVPDSAYHGTKLYESASSIPGSGILKEGLLTVDKPFIATARILAKSGCFQDVFVTTEGTPGCTFIPESLFGSEPYSLVIYPNPSSGPVKVAYKGDPSSTKVSIQLIDKRGIILENSEVSSQDGYFLHTFTITNLVPEHYLITVTDANKKITKTLTKY